MIDLIPLIAYNSLMKTVVRQCPVCEKTYEADPVRLRIGRQTTCSRECSYRQRADVRRTGVAHACASCGKVVVKVPSHMRSKHGSVFCSRACHYSGRSTGKSRRIVAGPYRYTPEGKAALIASARKPKGRRRPHVVTCLNCLKSFDDQQGYRRRKSGMIFCSLECCNAYRVGVNNPAWRGGHPEYYGPDWRKARRAARARDNHTCQRCGAQPKRAVDVHHIKPVVTFASPNDAHSADNLVSLCHPCHMLVEWRGMDFTWPKP